MAAVEWVPSHEGLAQFVRGLDPDNGDFDEQLSLLEDDSVEGESP